MSDWSEVQPGGEVAFRARFHDFGDTMLQSVELSIGSRSQRRARVSVMARDSLAQDAWILVEFEIKGLDGYHCDWPNNQGQEVLQSELHIVRGKSLTYLVMETILFFTDPLPTEAEALTAGFFFAGQTLRWRVRPLTPEDTQ